VGFEVLQNIMDLDDQFFSSFMKAFGL